MNIFENFDRASFWMGFFTAALVIFLSLRLRKYWVPVKEFATRYFRTIKVKQSTSSDSMLRQDILKRAQNAHLARTLFSLDEVLITPKVMAPAKIIEPDNPDLIASAQPQVIPNLPLVPQFNGQYNGETIAFPRLLRMGVNVAIVGNPGSGKSTTLAYLASLFARKDVSLGPLGQYFPIYLHYHDIQVFSANEPDPIKVLVKALSYHVAGSHRAQLPGFLQKQLQDNRAILLLDGLDEIPTAQYQQALGFLAALLKARPKLRVVTTASPDRAYGLLDLGIEPLTLAGWTRSDISNFINRWGSLWNKNISSNGHSSQGFDELLIAGWQAASAEFYTPIEWTARLWGAYYGDLLGARGADAIGAYCTRLQTYGVDVSRLAMLADRMLTAKQSQIAYVEAEKLFSEIIIPAATPLSEISFEPGNLTQNEVTFQAPIEPDKPTGRGSVGERTIDILVEYGVLRESIDERLSFASPVIWGFLTALAVKESDFDPTLVLTEPWSAVSEALHYRLVTTQTDWLKAYLSEDLEPFYTQTIQAGLWMRDLPPKDDSRTLIMRYLLQRVKSEDVPYLTRLSLLAAASLSNDPAVLTLDRQLAEAESPALRRIAILCSGALRDSKAFNTMVNALNHSDLLLRWAACFAIAALDTPDARNAAKTILDRSEEPLRLAMAEAMAARPPWGHDLLKKAESSSETLTRHALVFGLLHIRTPWAIDILERLAMEDGEWVVRNFAGQAVEYLQKQKRNNRWQYTPSPDAPWLTNYASRKGTGALKGGVLAALLLEILKSGSTEEKIAAIQLLARSTDRNASDGLRSSLNAQETGVALAAQDALWFLTVSRKPAVF